AAYAVQKVVASTAIKYGGPNNATSNDAFGGFVFEIWSTPTLLGGILYDPGTAVAVSANVLKAMTVLDTTNLRITFNAPASGNVFVRLKTTVDIVSGAWGKLNLGVLDGATV